MNNETVLDWLPTEGDGMLTVGSLFAGIGGLELGLERAGMKTAWQVEIGDYATRVLEKHWPDVKRWRDIRTFPPKPVDDWRVDVVCGGFPCQPFSSASRGRRRGTADDRYLWPEMLRICELLEPSWVVAENVDGLTDAEIEQVVSSLEGIGYEVAPILAVPACAFGHDHRRYRNWFIGYADRDRKPSVPVDAKMAGMQSGGCLPGGVGKTDGISARMDRLRCLGNAVVPDCTEWIGRAIVEAERCEHE